MSYRFSLATLLRLREIAEQREERLLAQIQSQIAEGRQTVAALRERRQLLITQWEETLRQRTSATQIQVFYGHKYHIEALIADGEEQLAKLQILCAQQMKSYEAAHQNRELLSGMKEEQLDNFRREETRKEQHQMDDNFSSRRGLH